LLQVTSPVRFRLLAPEEPKRFETPRIEKPFSGVTARGHPDKSKQRAKHGRDCASWDKRCMRKESREPVGMPRRR